MNTSFPIRLHDMLDESQDKGHSHIVSWCADGLSFKVHDPVLIVPILKEYFRQNKYQSFQRQLHGYDFRRQNYGVNRGKVSHPYFVRGQRKLAMRMRRQRGARSSLSNTQKHINNEGAFPSPPSSTVGDAFTLNTTTPATTPATATTPKTTTRNGIDRMTTMFPLPIDPNRSSPALGISNPEQSQRSVEAILNMRYSRTIDPRTSFGCSPYFSHTAMSLHETTRTQIPQFPPEKMMKFPSGNPMTLTRPIQTAFATPHALLQTTTHESSGSPLAYRHQYIEALKNLYVFEAKREIERLLEALVETGS